MQVFDYLFNVGGNYTASVNGMTEATGDFEAHVKSAQNWAAHYAQALWLEKRRLKNRAEMLAVMFVGK